MPKPHEARPIAKCLDADASMARLAAHAKRLLTLQRSLESALPAALSRQCRIANHKLGVIVIHANNGAVATKVRQNSATLVREFVTTGIEVTEIKVRVQPRESDVFRRPSPQGNTLSEKSQSSLTSLASNLPDGSRLKDALNRLIRRSRSA